MDKFKAFVIAEKKWILALIAGIAAGATAAGYGIPQGAIDFVVQLVNSVN